MAESKTDLYLQIIRLKDRIAELNARQPDKEQQLIIEDLAMLIRRLCAGQAIADKAIDYLNRKGLQGTILRDDKEKSNGP